MPPIFCFRPFFGDVVQFSETPGINYAAIGFAFEFQILATATIHACGCLCGYANKYLLNFLNIESFNIFRRFTLKSITQNEKLQTFLIQ